MPTGPDSNTLGYPGIVGADNGRQEMLACRFDTSYHN